VSISRQKNREGTLACFLQKKYFPQPFAVSSSFIESDSENTYNENLAGGVEYGRHHKCFPILSVASPYDYVFVGVGRTGTPISRRDHAESLTEHETI
jgi:hypothetical protein